MLRSGERQVAPTLDGIRADHRARYEWVAGRLAPGSWVLDYGCGVGYGARILAEAGHRVIAFDIDEDAIAYAREHYGHPNIQFLTGDPLHAVFERHGDGPLDSGQVTFSAAVCFEVIEHIAEPAPLLRKIRESALSLYASVPNEAEFPFRSEANHFKGYAFHHRHYTRGQFEQLLKETGWLVNTWYGQAGPESPVERGAAGRTIIAVGVADRNAIPLYEVGAREPVGYVRDGPKPGEGQIFLADAVEPQDWSPHVVQPEVVDAVVAGAPAPAGPGHVVILGLGPSLEQYVDLVKRLGSRHAFADQVWAINALGDVLQCDLVFHMDDVRVQELRAAAAPKSNIARMVEWLKTHPGPVMTSRAHPDYPGLVEFPLEAVINDLAYAYFNGTAAYAVAYAIHLGASKISLFGCDFSYANSHQAEKGRACVEFWLGVAAARGIELGFADRTSLMDSCEDPPDGELSLYGYDCETVKVETIDGSARIAFEPKEPPTAEEVERRYDHSRPTVSPELLKRA